MTEKTIEILDTEDKARLYLVPMYLRIPLTLKRRIEDEMLRSGRTLTDIVCTAIEASLTR